MKLRPSKFLLIAFLIISGCTIASWNVVAQNNGRVPFVKALAEASTRAQSTLVRPQYQLSADIDWELLTFRSRGQITVPVAAGDAMRDVVFFVFANAGGVGGSDARRKNIAVDEVSLDGAKVLWSLNGPVLRVRLPQPRSQSFTLDLRWHGVVPRSPDGGGTIIDMLGGMGSDMGDLGGLLGGMGGASAPKPKPKNVDYGLYTYGNGILSLGSFWYPSLAVRRNGQWIDEAPEGLGDVAFSEMSDYSVSLRAPQNVKIAAPGARSSAGAGTQVFEAENVRDFAVLMSEDYVTKWKTVDVGGHPVRVEAFTSQANAAKADKSIDIAANALRIYARRFGPYPYDRFVVAEGPMRAGAGGMEYSGMTAIASMLYGDWAKQLGELSQALTGSLGGGPAGDLLDDLENEAFGDGASKPAPKAPTTQAPARAAQKAEIAAPDTDNPAMDFLHSTLGQQKAVLETLLEATIAHEVAHQWWAIGVGSDSIRAPWVDESLTNYSSMIYFEDRYGKETAQQMIDLHLKTTYSMGRMLGNADAPVNLRTAAYSGNVQYGAIVYGKGALFYDALRRTIGDEAFFAGLREYYGTYRNRLTDAGALMQTFQRRAPARTQAIRTLYKRWILEAHGDEDITGGKPMGVEDLLGSMLGGTVGDE